MSKSTKNWLFWATIGTLALVSGCSGGSGKTATRVIPPSSRPVMKEASQEELLERYNSYAHSVKSVNATVELRTTTGSEYQGVIDEYHEVKAFLLAQRPQEIRVIGQVPVIGKTIFDMASDGNRFALSIPPRNKFLEGPVALERNSSKPIENLRPQHLYEVLLWPEVKKEEAVLIEEANEETARYYVLTVLRGGYRTEVLRKIWFDRADLLVARFESYGPKGTLLSDVRYSDWQPVLGAGPAADSPTATGGALSYPRRIRLERPHDEYRLDMSISKLALNEPLEAERFKLAAPSGVEITHLGDGNEAKTP